MDKQLPIQLQNTVCSLTVDLYGGAITDFHLHHNSVNPLSFRFREDEMPANNKGGARYQGHFICGGRWGAPSAGEMLAGLPNHGEPANIVWSLREQTSQSLAMQVHAAKEGLQIYRTIKLAHASAMIHVSETIQNINPLGRLYQYVQHATIAAPFLTAGTQVNCNATKGFDYMHINDAARPVLQWPDGYDAGGNIFSLQESGHMYNSVFSFTVSNNALYGWLTAYDPHHRLLLGYVWPAKDYPWINLWQHYEGNEPKYRGLEFGNTGLHQPFKEIIAGNKLELFGKKTVEYLDAGESVTKSYSAFLLPVEKHFSGVAELLVENNGLYLKEAGTPVKTFIGTINFESVEK